MGLQPGLTKVDNLNVMAVVEEARKEGRAAYVLPSTGVVNRESFFEAVRATLPLDPPLVGSRSWDALSDSLWSGLNAIGEKRIVIVWPNSTTMRRSAADDYDLAWNILADVAATLADPKATNGNPKEVTILLG
jgi:hypothetical protein